MEKLNELSFCVEPIEYDDGIEIVKFNAFYYIVDGKKLDFGTRYQPASKYEILEDEEDYLDEKHKMVILNCCSCGEWSCDCYVAKVVEKENRIEWFIHRLRAEPAEPPDYVFDRKQYEKVMQEIKTAAQND